MPRWAMVLFEVLLLASLRAEAADTSDLPLVEVRARQGSDLLAVFFSGSGGWAALDQEVAAGLAAAGVRVIGVNSFRYFWHERLPDPAAQDLVRVLNHYLAAAPPGTKVVLIGYSSGADVLPFLVNRLPVSLRARIAAIALIAPAREAEFRIRLLAWIRQSEPHGRPLWPEVRRLPPLPVLCMYGKGDDSTLCPILPPRYATVEVIGKGHHLGGHYAQIAERILSFARPSVKRVSVKADSSPLPRSARAAH